MKSSKKVKNTVAKIVALGREHRTLIRETVVLINMLKARARNYTGYENLMSGEGEVLSKAKCSACYKHLLTDRNDPIFLQSVQALITVYDDRRSHQLFFAKQMGDLAMELPIWNWVKDQVGCGAPMLGKIIAESGHVLDAFETPAKLWKRFGLEVIHDNNGGAGSAPRPRKGETLGYSPYRRSVAWQLGDCLIKSGEKSYWYRLYVWRKKYEVLRASEDGMVVVPAAKIKNGATKDGKKARSEKHVHLRAKRYMEKKFLERLWEEWTGDARKETLPKFVTEGQPSPEIHKSHAVKQKKMKREKSKEKELRA